ncbi:MAG: ArnT family glycosyltransferase [Geminicoccaceae bacterium]
METASQRETLSLSLKDVRVLCAALVTLFAVRLLAVFLFPFTDTTEARYAEIARKMVETRDWITPQFEYGVPFWGKPPLHTWLSAGGMEVFGVGEFGARIFIFAAALGLLWLFYRWTTLELGRDMALVATTVLASSGLFYIASAFVMTDLPLIVGTTMSMIGFWSLAGPGESRTGWSHLIFLGLAVGLMAKGPVAILLTGIPIGLWILIGNRWRLLLRVPWVSGLALTLALTVPWYIAAELKTPGFLNYFLVGEHFERFVVSGWKGDLYGSGHAEPKGMIWIFWPGMFLPWTLFCIALLFKAGKVFQAFRQDDTGWRSYLLLWTIAPMILFTPAANILPAYVLPGLPAASLLLVTLWADIWSGRPSLKARGIFLAGLGGIAALVLSVSVLSVVAPTEIGLKSQKKFVQKATELAPEGSVFYWQGRNYSSEFYTSGNSSVIHDVGSVIELANNGTRDVLAVRRNNSDQLEAKIDRHFERIGVYGRYVLFVERNRPEMSDVSSSANRP